MKAADWKAFLYQPLLTAEENGVWICKVALPLQLEPLFLKAVLEGDKDIELREKNHKMEPYLCGIPIRFDKRLRTTFLFVLESKVKTDKFTDPGGVDPPQQNQLC